MAQNFLKTTCYGLEKTFQELVPYFFILTIGLAPLLMSCGSDDPSGDTSLTRIEIASSNGDLIDLNQTTTLTVNGFDQSNQAININSTLEWSANNTNVTVDQNGVVTGQSVGMSTITATTQGISATFDIEVWDSSQPRTEIYVSDAGINSGPPYQILRFNENGQNPRVFTNEQLSWPQDIIFLEEQGVVLISNLNSGRINRHNVNTGEFIDFFASGISGPTRMKIGPDNLLYVLQWRGNGRVLRYELDGTKVADFSTDGVNQSIGLDWDTDGNLYVSSFNNGAAGFVRKFDPDGNDMGNFIAAGLQGPTDIWFSENGDLWVNDWSGGAIRRFNTSGGLIGNVATGLSNPEGIDFLPNGNFLIGNGGTSSVRMYSSTGSFIGDFIQARSGNLSTPNAVRVRTIN